MEYTLRNAQPKDLERIEQIYAYARGFMAQTGNPTQWGNHYPPHAQLIRDIADKTLYVIESNECIHGVFYFFIGDDPTYAEMENGCWRSDSAYGTIHRIASDGSGGILSEAVAFCESKIHHLRIDTHRDNTVMQKALAKQGFQKRGIIRLEDGSPRIAYDRLTE